jgi:hypothetical protein
VSRRLTVLANPEPDRATTFRWYMNRLMVNELSMIAIGKYNGHP